MVLPARFRKAGLALALGPVLATQPGHAAVITVNSVLDNGGTPDASFCTLREAIVSANENSATNAAGCVPGGVADSIVFAPGLIGGGAATINLTGNSALNVNSPLAVYGPGQEKLKILSNGQSTVLRVIETEFSLEGLTLSGGTSTTGGGIYVYAATVSIKSVTISGNSSNEGGGILNRGGTIELIDSTVSGNNASEIGGGIHSAYADTTAGFSFPTMTVTNSTISDNNAAVSGGALSVYDTDLEIIKSVISGNSALNAGGTHLSSSSATISNSRISGNSAQNDGGGLRIIADGYLNLAGTTVRDNTAGASGGGLYCFNSSSVFIEASTVSGNSAANNGGGLNIRDCTVALFNSTVSHNTANSFGGGLVMLDYSTGVVNHVTMSGNSAGVGGAISTTFSTLALGNSILANSAGGMDCWDVSMSQVNDFGGVLVEEDFNCGTFALENVQPYLGPLRDNGGPTMTHALLQDSPAIQAGVSLFCQKVDQRGIERQRPCDIGAFEIDRGMCFAVRDRNGGTVILCL